MHQKKKQSDRERQSKQAERKSMGRPKSDNPKDNQIHFLCDSSTLEMLEYVSSHKELSKSDVIRMGITAMYRELFK